MTEVLFTGNPPDYAHQGDAGADLVADSDYIVGYGQVTQVHTGTYLAMPDRVYGEVVPRSGWGTKYGLALANTVGIIDPTYRGEILLQLTLNRPGTLSIRKGDRVAQIIFKPFMRAQFHRVQHLPDSVRGTDGFGSTGI